MNQSEIVYLVSGISGLFLVLIFWKMELNKIQRFLSIFITVFSLVVPVFVYFATFRIFQAYPENFYQGLEETNSDSDALIGFAVNIHEFQTPFLTMYWVGTLGTFLIGVMIGKQKGTTGKN